MSEHHLFQKTISKIKELSKLRLGKYKEMETLYLNILGSQNNAISLIHERLIAF